MKLANADDHVVSNSLISMALAQMSEQADVWQLSEDLFSQEGNEIHTDFAKAMQLVKDSGYKGYVGVEYEGGKLSEDDGIKATKALLEKVIPKLS